MGSGDLRSDLGERAIFRALITVPNVGPRTALTILGSVPIQELARAVEAGDVVRLSKVPGIGKKTAERLIVELKGKLASAAHSTPQAVSGSEVGGGQSGRLVAALTNMGYRGAEAERAVDSLGDRAELATMAEALRDSLAFLSRR